MTAPRIRLIPSVCWRIPAALGALENTLRGRLDLSFGEDARRLRKDHAPRARATMRQRARNLLPAAQQKRESLKRLRKSRLGASNTQSNPLNLMRPPWEVPGSARRPPGREPPPARLPPRPVREGEPATPSLARSSSAGDDVRPWAYS